MNAVLEWLASPPDSWVDWAIFVGIAFLVSLPTRYDPAIRLKEWTEKRRNKKDEPNG